jgi:error-prone DNA polymerase
LNFIAAGRGADGERSQTIHRRDALWQIERAARRPGPLLEAVLEAAEIPPQCASRVRAVLAARAISDTPPRGLAGVAEGARTVSAGSPLLPMTVEERLLADFRGTGITVGPHPLAYHRAELKKQGVRSASELPHLPNGSHVCIAGAVIARQRPGTAKGFVFLSLEDETGIANAIFTPQIFEKNHLAIVHQPFLFIAGQLQNQENVVSIKAVTVRPLSVTRAETASHDFH